VTDINLEGINNVQQEIIDEVGGNTKAVLLDVTNYVDVEKFIGNVIVEHGTIDILVNNAGILKRNSDLETITDEDWDLVMSVNVKGVFNCTKAVLPKMKEQKYGKIVNLSSTAGKSTSELGGAHYTTSKAAVLGLTRHTAREAAPHNINVNAICPSLIDTPMIRETTEPQELNKFIKEIPMGRIGTPDEAALLILFLVSDASSFVNGATIDFTGASLLI
jgi:3-oxoacyl-[acyl-carrier protein] reductase